MIFMGREFLWGKGKKSRIPVTFSSLLKKQEKSSRSSSSGMLLKSTALYLLGGIAIMNVFNKTIFR